MTPIQKTKALTAVAVALTLTVAACGGGGGGGGESNSPGSDVGQGATQDSRQATSFTANLAGSTNDNGEPIALGDAQLATSETDEPAPL